MSTAPDSLVDEHEVWQRPFVRMHRRWCDDFILELRLRDVPGARIGDHLAEVESHCIETGTDPKDAFGDAREYAQEVGDADELRDLARDDLPGPPAAHRSGTDDDHACGTLRGQAGEAGQGGRRRRVGGGVGERPGLR